MEKTIPLLGIVLPILLATLTPATAQPIPDFQVNENASPDGSEQSDPQIAGDGLGNYVVTWQDKRNGIDFNIFAQIFASDGTATGVNFRVNQEEGHFSQYRPDVAVDADLNFVIVWLDKQRGDWEVYGQRYGSDGTALGDHFIANDDPAETEQECPSVLMDASGDFVVVWADDRSGDWDVYAQRYAGDGTALGGDTLISDGPGSATQYWPASAGNAAGDFVVTWTDERSGDYDIYVRRYSADGTALGGGVKANTDTGDADQMVSAAAVDAGGNCIVAWSDKRSGHWDVYAQRYSSDGLPAGDNFKVNGASLNLYHNSPAVSTDQVGNFIVSWTDGNDDDCDILAQRYAADGTPLGVNFQVNDNPGDSYEYHSEILVNHDGSFTVAWDDHRLGDLGDIYTQSYASDGTAVETNVKVNDDLGSENQAEPAIAKDGAGNFIIAWSDMRADCGDIYVQRYASDGTELGPDVKVNDDGASYCQWEPAVAADADGNFMVVWTDWRQDLWYVSDIYAQRFSADGMPLGTNFVVNTSGAYIHISPQIVSLSDGGYIVVWGDSLAESLKHRQVPGCHTVDASATEKGPRVRGTEPDIYYQQLSNDGTPLGGNIKVNDDTGNTSQTSPTIAVDADDNFTIAWEDRRLGGRDIYFQRFAPDSTPLGGNTRVDVGDPANDQRQPSLAMAGDGEFVIAWKDDRDGLYDIYAQRFSDNGGALGGDFKISSDNQSIYHSRPSVAMDALGNIVVTWSERRDGHRDVFARRYLSGGMPFSGIYRVPNTTELEQADPVVVLGDGRIVTAWMDNRGERSGYDIWANVMDWDAAVGVEDSPPPLTALRYLLDQNHPNPFNPATSVGFNLPEPTRVSFRIYDVAGRIVRTLIAGEAVSAGHHEITWHGTDESGQTVASGTYFYRLEAGGYAETRRMTLLK